MPLDSYSTRPDFSRQIKQYSGTTAILSGATNILEKFSVKNIEIDTQNALDGNTLVFDSNNNKFLPATVGAFGSSIIQGLILTYDSGLTYNISSGSYRIGTIVYGYTSGNVTIESGQTGGSRFDVVYITSAQTAYVKSGITATNPTVPSLSGGELEIGIIFVPINFTGGTGTTIIQTTADTVFEYYNAGTGIQRSPNTTNAQAPGNFSFAPTRNSIAYGQDSVALGYYSRASGNSQTVVGQYNTPNTDDYFIVGNGISDGSRSNAFRVTTGGSAYIQNKLYVTNVEVETTGASNNYALISNGIKFTPQLLTLQKITESGNTTTNSIGVNQITATSIFLSSGFTFISGYNSYSNPSELRVLLADDLGSREASTDTYQLNYFTENITKGINPLTRGIYSAFTTTTSASYIVTATSITVGKESFVKITGITSGDTAIGTVFRNRFETKNYNANNGVDDTTKNLVGSAFFNQINSTKSNTTPFVGTLFETHLLGNQQPTYHNEIRNIQLGVFNRAWVYATSAQTYIDLYINRPVVSDEGYNSYGGFGSGGQTLRLNKHASIFIESRESVGFNDVLNRTLNTPISNVIFENKPWSIFAEADRAYIGNTLVLASAQTLASTTRGAWLDIGASQATRPHINLSAGTDPSSPQSGDLWWNGSQLYFRSGSTSFNLLSGGTGGSGSSTGITSGTSLGDGVKVLFSSNTNNLAFATLSSQTPSTLRIISSSTGVILFSATTGSGPVTGNFIPLTGTTSGSPMQGNLVFSGTNGIIVQNDANNLRNSLTSSGLTLGLISPDLNINITPSFANATSTILTVPDTATGSGLIVSVPDIGGQANKLIKVKSDELGFDFHENFITITYANALAAAQDQTGTGTLTQGQWYRIEAVDRGADETINYNTYGDIFLKAITNNRFSPDGYLLAINADYNGVGDYSDVPSFSNTQRGVAYDNMSVSTGDVVIWSNTHYQIGDYIHAFPPSPWFLTDISQLSDPNYNCTPLPKDYTTRNGYIIEPQKIVYDVITNTINRMEDKRGNVVINNASNYIENFRFGDNNVFQNHISTSLSCGIINYPYLAFQSNTMRFGTIENPVNLVDNSVVLNIVNCNIQDSYFQNDYLQSLYLYDANIQDNKILSSEIQFTLTSSTITLPMNTNGTGWYYDQNITLTGGTFNGIVTAITQDNQITNYNQKFRFFNNSGSNIIFRNSTFLKTEGGLDAIITSNIYDSIEFIIYGSIAYQTDINNYI
jgi:hypothetical protein